MGEASCGNILDFSQNTVYCYSSVLHFINCNKFTLHSKLKAARRSAFVGGGVNFSAARRRGVARRGSLTPQFTRQMRHESFLPCGM